jgi:hypothetical protein
MSIAKKHHGKHQLPATMYAHGCWDIAENIVALVIG